MLMVPKPEEEGLDLADDDYNPLSAYMPMTTLLEEDVISLSKRVDRDGVRRVGCSGGECVFEDFLSSFTYDYFPTLLILLWPYF